VRRGHLARGYFEIVRRDKTGESKDVGPFTRTYARIIPTCLKGFKIEYLELIADILAVAFKLRLAIGNRG